MESAGRILDALTGILIKLIIAALMLCGSLLLYGLIYIDWLRVKISHIRFSSQALEETLINYRIIFHLAAKETCFIMRK